jgi:hypothetical protein
MASTLIVRITKATWLIATRSHVRVRILFVHLG